MIPPNHVVVDVNWDTDDVFLSEWGGHVTPKALWDEYEAKKAELDALAERMRAGDYIDGWEQNGRERPPPKEGGWDVDRVMMDLARSLTPMPTPFRNKLPRP